MSMFKKCPRCGAHLDPGEQCDCPQEQTPRVDEPVVITVGAAQRRRNEPSGIYLPRNNKHGYGVNITHPEIEPKYREYRRRLGIPIGCALSDEQRKDFEREIVREQLNQFGEHIIDSMRKLRRN